MASNKFATMLHKNTNQITLVLIYTFLEWILIILLLINSLFSYLISRFARYFGLKAPCILCSRLDHIFEPKDNHNSFKDLVCEAHAIQISNMGYCSNHQKLSDFRDVCQDCSSSSFKPSNSNNNDDNECSEFTDKFAFFPWMNKIGMVENGEEEILFFKCSCCGQSFDHQFYPPCFVIDPSWGVLDFTQKHNMMIKEEEDGLDQPGMKSVKEQGEDGKDVEEENRGIQVREIEVDEEEKELVRVEELIEEDCDRRMSKIDCSKNAYSESGFQHLEFYIGGEDCQLIPVELIDFMEAQTETKQRGKEEEREYYGGEDVVLDFDMNFDAQFEPLAASSSAKEDLLQEEKGEAAFETQNPSNEEEDARDHQEDNLLESDEIEAEISIGTEIPEHEQEHIGVELHSKDYLNILEEHSTSSGLVFNNLNDSKQDEEIMVEMKTLVVDPNEEAINHHQIQSISEHEEKSGMEESLDGSVMSEIDSGDAVVTVEKLKDVLRSKRKALDALYSELEEERSASAVAANQTMAMINRLQEEKAAMQMEALHYQRMMEEQSEYDQEALQLLNELVVKREREKQEVERELEVYRKRVEDFEAKETAVRLRNMKCTSSSSSSSSNCSHCCEDSDFGLSIDLNNNSGVKVENGLLQKQETGNYQNTPADEVLCLEESLEEERQSILDHLKMLEEKLFSFTDEEEDKQFFEHENGNGYHETSNGFGNGQGKRFMGSKAKRLLPLFNDALEEEEEMQDGEVNGNEEMFEHVSMQKSLDFKYEHEFKRVAIEEEFDHVYDRLQALEADREFLRHCIGSLRKGGKGLHLLQEILQHLRDLKSVDLRVKNVEDGPI